MTIDKISDEDQGIRKELLFDREQDIQNASFELAGSWSMWRTMMNKKYGLLESDTIDRDGSIKKEAPKVDADKIQPVTEEKIS
jgi:peroxiredoxin